MSVQLIQAPNMKHALRRIQNEIGLDALIYRSRPCVGGIEVLAGLPIDGENTTPLDAAFNDEIPKNIIQQLSLPVEKKLTALDETMRALAEKISRLSTNNQLNVTNSHQVTETTEYLRHIGFSDEMTHILFKDILNLSLTPDEMLTSLQQKISNMIQISQNDIFQDNSIAAVVGPTGIGKTTTIIKIAARFLMNHNANELGIMSTDIDDHSMKNKLQFFCKTFGVQFDYFNTSSELSSTFKKMKDKKFILIDTHGVGQRDDVAIKNLIALFSKVRRKMAIYVALPCNQQESILNEILEKYKFKKIAGCILTKTDESIKITPAVSVIMKHQLPIAYLCNGQHIEKDISIPNKNDMLKSISISVPEQSNEKKVVKKPAVWKQVFKAIGFKMY